VAGAHHAVGQALAVKLCEPAPATLLQPCIELLQALKEKWGRTSDRLKPDMPFGDWMDFWYQNFSKPKIRQTTQECYENRIYNHIIPEIMKEAINAVGDKFGLPNGWVNDDFKKTSSYTPKIVQYSEYYRTFSSVLQIRTIRAEYLVAMKLMSGRQYKKDLSDIVGIIYEQQIAGKPLSYEMIDTAVRNLYGDWNNISDHARDILDKVFARDDIKELFIELSEDEKAAKEALFEIVKKYPTAVKQDNVDDVIAATLKRKRQRESS